MIFEKTEKFYTVIQLLKRNGVGDQKSSTAK